MNKIDITTFGFTPAKTCKEIAELSYSLAVTPEFDHERIYHLFTGFTFVAFAAEAMLNHLHSVFCSCSDTDKPKVVCRGNLYSKTPKQYHVHKTSQRG